jgi:peptidoglycan/LPS O-acetylase OafA/YrhL
LPGNLHYFFAGICLADVHVLRSGGRRRQSVVWDLIAVPAWVCIPLFAVQQYHSLLLPITIMAAYSGALWGRLLHGLFSRVWLATIGGMCYTIYLYHYLIMLAVGPLTLRLPRTGVVLVDHGVQYIILGAVILGLSGVLFALFERPFMVPDWPKHLVQFAKKWRLDATAHFGQWSVAAEKQPQDH